MNHSFFITSSGTDIGKTFITCALAHQLRAAGHSVCALKPIVTGWDDSLQSDTMQILQSLDLPITAHTINQVSPWRFTAPLSPNIAADLEGKPIHFDEVVKFCQRSRTEDVILIEGVGGVMVPLTTEHTVLNLMKALDIPAILVVGSYLGSLSHTLTAITALEQADIDIHRIVICESADSTVSLADTEKSLAHFTSCPIFTLPRLPSQPQLWQGVPALLSLVDK